jgi:cytochrome b561
MNKASESGFDTTTRTTPAADAANYDAVAIFLHWATALLVIVQFALAHSWDWFPDATRETMESAHVSLGILLTAVIAARLAWRSVPGHRRAPLVGGWMGRASKSVHYLLYLLLVVQAGLGFVIGWAVGHPIHFFGIPIPGPFDPLPRPVRHELREIHDYVGWAIVVIACGHALAALYHHHVLRDRVLERMLPAAR